MTSPDPVPPHHEPTPPPLPSRAGSIDSASGYSFQVQRALQQKELDTRALHERHAAAFQILDQKLRTPEVGRSTMKKALILVVTLAAFILWLTTRGDGGTTSAFVDAALLIGVLFLHELGHLAAMKFFGYRDVTLFFIPFFGAAVTGKKSDAEPWQEAVMVLAGPLPGIFIGLPMLAYSYMHPNDLLQDASNILIALNALNLLPIKPLDGGKFFDIVLFCRWRWMSSLFGAFSVVGFALFLYYVLRFSLVTVGILILIQLGGAWRQWKLRAALQATTKGATLQPDGTVTSEDASLIFDGIETAFAPTQLKPPALAEWARQHLQSRVQKSPSIGASAALFTVYLLTVGLLAAGFVFLVMLKDAPLVP